MDSVAEGLHLLRRQGAGLIADVHADAGGQRPVQIALEGGLVVHVPEQVQAVFLRPLVGAVVHQPLLIQAGLLDRALLPLQGPARQRPVHLRDELADGCSVKENQVRLDRQVASFRRPVHRGAEQRVIHHRHHGHEGLHEVQPAFLRPFKNGNIRLRVRHGHHAGHTLGVGPNDVFHAGMGVQHLFHGVLQRFRADALRGPGQIRDGIGGLAAAGQALQIDAQLRLRQGIGVPVHGRQRRVPAGFHEGRQFPGRGMEGNILEGKRGLPVRQAADQQRGAEAGSSAVKEAGRGADPGHVQGLGEGFADPLLRLRSGRLVLRLLRPDFQGLQRRIVDLVPVVPEHGVQVNKVFRNHVFRQVPAHMGLHLLRGGFLPGIVAADQVPAVDADIHAGRFPDRIQPSHDLVNFAQLDPVSPNLHHPVVPPVEDQAAFLIPGHLVPAVIQACPGPEGVFRKAFRRFLRQIVVTVRHPGAADAQLPDVPGLLDFPAFLVQQPYLHAAARFPQALRSAASGRMQQSAEAFAGAKELQHARPVFRSLRLLPREDHIFQRQVSVKLLQHAVHLGRAEHAGDLPLREQRMDRLHVFPFRLVGDIHAAAAAEHRRKVQQARNKAEAGNVQRPGMLRHGNLSGKHRGRAAQDGLPVNDALGLSG